jgi:hypothetical protein
VGDLARFWFGVPSPQYQTMGRIEAKELERVGDRMYVMGGTLGSRPT